MLSVRDLTITFNTSTSTLVAVDGMSFDVQKGEIFVIIGESGSGKTLTGLSLLGLQPEAANLAGSIVFDGQELVGATDRLLRGIRGKDLAMIYQDPLGSLNPVWPIGDQIAEALVIHRVADKKSAASRAVELLAEVGIPDPARVANLYAHQISGGMRQRAMIAMALSCGPKFLIADEPTTALDVTIKAQILDLLKKLRDDNGLAIILITHDMHVVGEMADRILVMYAGRVVETGPADRILENPSHPYTAGLLRSAAIGELQPQTDIEIIPGNAPSISAFPSGCRFHPRCFRATDLCAHVQPPLVILDDVARACHHPLDSFVEECS